MNLLHIDSSITGDASVSRKLTAEIVQRLVAADPALTVVRRDLAAEPLPYFSAETIAAVFGSPGSTDEARLDRVVLREFLDADIVVIGAPMYNFGVPAQLKTWIDYLSIVGVTFEYTAEGPRGLAGGKRVIIASSRGGMYGPGSPAAPMEHQTSYLETVLGFFGVTDVTVIEAEGIKVSPDVAQAAVAQARRDLKPGPATGRLIPGRSAARSERDLDGRRAALVSIRRPRWSSEASMPPVAQRSTKRV